MSCFYLLIWQSPGQTGVVAFQLFHLGFIHATTWKQKFVFINPHHCTTKISPKLSPFICLSLHNYLPISHEYYIYIYYIYTIIIVLFPPNVSLKVMVIAEEPHNSLAWVLYLFSSQWTRDTVWNTNQYCLRLTRDSNLGLLGSEPSTLTAILPDH